MNGETRRRTESDGVVERGHVESDNERLRPAAHVYVANKESEYHSSSSLKLELTTIVDDFQAPSLALETYLYHDR